MTDKTGSASERRRGALAGLKVLDLSRVLAGPLCAQMLSDHGADVIKVEAPGGDETRLLGPPFVASGDAAYFGAVNRGKRAIAIDLSKNAGRAVLTRLIERADVLIENFLPGTMERWGFSYEHDLAKRHPNLVYCQISGFGNDGPLGGLPGYDAILQAICGLMSINGSPQTGPTRLGVPVVDHLTAYTAMTGILLALNARAATGRGQKVEATLFDTALSLLVPHAANTFASGKAPGLLGSAHPNIAPYDKFMAADGEIFVGVLTDSQFRKFVEFIGRPDLAMDSRFVNNQQRVRYRTELRTEIEEALSAQDRDSLCQGLMRVGVPAGAVNSVPDALSQEHALHRGMVVDVDGHRGLGPSVRLSANPAGITRGSPAFASGCDEILHEAGFSTEEIDSLRSAGIIPAHR